MSVKKNYRYSGLESIKQKQKQRIQRINEIKNWFFEKINKIEKLISN